MIHDVPEIMKKKLVNAYGYNEKGNIICYSINNVCGFGCEYCIMKPHISKEDITKGIAINIRMGELADYYAEKDPHKMISVYLMGGDPLHSIEIFESAIDVYINKPYADRVVINIPTHINYSDEHMLEVMRVIKKGEMVGIPVTLSPSFHIDQKNFKDNKSQIIKNIKLFKDHINYINIVVEHDYYKTPIRKKRVEMIQQLILNLGLEPAVNPIIENYGAIEKLIMNDELDTSYYHEPFENECHFEFDDGSTIIGNRYETYNSQASTLGMTCTITSGKPVGQDGKIYHCGNHIYWGFEYDGKYPEIKSIFDITNEEYDASSTVICPDKVCVCNYIESIKRID